MSTNSIKGSIAEDAMESIQHLIAKNKLQVVKLNEALNSYKYAGYEHSDKPLPFTKLVQPVITQDKRKPVLSSFLTRHDTKKQILKNYYS